MDRLCGANDARCRYHYCSYFLSLQKYSERQITRAKPATERSPIVRQLDACRTTRKLDTGGIRRGVNKQQVAPPSE